MRHRAAPILGMGAAALAISIASALWNRPASAWVPVAEALRKQAWAHSKTLGPDGRALSETWFSGRDGVVAYKSEVEVGFLDSKLKVFTRFVREEGVVHRLPENRDRSGFPNSVKLYQQVLDGRVAEQTRGGSGDGRRSGVDLDLTFRLSETPDAPLRVKLRVDPETNLPRSWQSLTKSGWATTTVDYPDSGPADIYSLGIPRDAEVIDRVPSNDPERILAGLEAGRSRFDDYCAFVVGVGRNVHRIWKKGDRWRAERLLPGRKNWPPPPGADASWWKAHQADFVFTTAAICDGATIHYYRMRDHVWSPDIEQPPPIRSNGAQPISGPADDPTMPWPHLMPEQLGHPIIRLPGGSRIMHIEPRAEDGPSGSIRLTVRDAKSSGAEDPEADRFWIRPDRNFLCLQSERFVFESTRPTRVASMETCMLESLALSPQGHWYPTRVRRKSSNSAIEQVTDFHLDFDAEIPDELFQPLKLAD